MTKRIYLAVLFLWAFTATSVHANYDRLRESLEPVAQECIAVNWETLTVNGELIAVINLMCHTFVNNIHWEEAKYLWINATKQERNRYNGHFYLYD